MRCVSRLFSGVAVAVVVVLGGCAGNPTLSTTNLYSPSPGRQDVQGSQGQGLVSRSLDLSPRESMAAARQALSNLGYEAGDSSSPLVASGRYTCDGRHRVTMAVYVQPEGGGSRVTVLFANHDRPCSLGNVPELGASQVFREIVRIIETG